MDEYKANRYGHRERMRDHYIASGYTGMSDSLLLELYLGQIIPQKDVKPTVYELQNAFGGLEDIFSADFEELVNVKYVGENTALLIVLTRKIIEKSLGQRTFCCLKDTEQRKKYIEKEVKNLNDEAVIFLALDNRGLLCAKLIINGSPQLTPESKGNLLSMLLNSNASNCMVVHYLKSMQPIESSIYFFSVVKDTLNKINIRLAEAAVASKDEIRLISDTAYLSLLQ